MKWQPIETAPKDGTEIFLCNPGSIAKHPSARFAGLGSYRTEEKIVNGKIVESRKGWHFKAATDLHPDDIGVILPSHWAPITYPE